MKTNFVPIFLIVYTINLYANISETVNYLFANREHLADLAKPVFLNAGNKTMRRQSEGMRIILQYSDKEKSSWEADMDTIVHAFLDLCISNKNLDTTGRELITDTVLIRGIVKALDCGKIKYESQCYRIFIAYIPYRYMKQYSSEIIEKVCSSLLDKNEINTLAALSGPPDSIKEKLLADSMVSMPLRARLGDKNAEDKLIKLFKDAKEFTVADIAAKNLFICGSKRCLSELVRSFNRPVYEIGRRGCVSNSLRVSIISGLKRYYPDEDLFTTAYHKFSEKSHGIILGRPYYVPDPEVKKYLEDFVAWGKKEFGVIPEGEIGEPILFAGPCDSLYINK